MVFLFALLCLSLFEERMRNVNERTRGEDKEEKKKKWSFERDDFRGGASLILLKVVKRRARNYSSETRFLNWGKSLDRTAAGSINGTTPPIARASRCDRFTVPTKLSSISQKWRFRWAVEPASLIVLCENSKLTETKWDTELVHARVHLFSTYLQCLPCSWL